MVLHCTRATTLGRYCRDDPAGLRSCYKFRADIRSSPCEIFFFAAFSKASRTRVSKTNPAPIGAVCSVLRASLQTTLWSFTRSRVHPSSRPTVTEKPAMGRLALITVTVRRKSSPESTTPGTNRIA